MYNEQIENLISAALADGVLTEKEKQILFKRAESMGIDLDEFEMVLDARLAELKKKEAQDAKQYELEMEKAKAAQKSAPKSNKFGDVRKCPACGAMIDSLQAKCPECGYEFTNIEANSTAKALLKELEKIDAAGNGMFGGLTQVFGTDSVTKKKIQLIKNFPIPNTKEDLLEMLSLCNENAEPYSGGVEGQRLSFTWESKINQLVLKARMVLKDDTDFEYLLAEIERDKKKRKIKRLYPILPALVLFIISIIGGIIACLCE